MVDPNSSNPPLWACTLENCLLTERSPYGYQPNKIANGVFTGIFVAALLLCLYNARQTKRWLQFSIPVSLACVLEITGFSTRFASAFDPWEVRLFAASTTLLTVAPPLISYGIYSTASHTITILGTEHSLIDREKYTRLSWIDAGGFVLQVIGVAVTFSDLSLSTGLGQRSTKGEVIMAAGTALQALSLLCFLVLFAVVLIRATLAYRHFGYTTFHPHLGFIVTTRKFKIFLSMMILSAGFLFWRAIFHTVLLSSGWNSGVAKIEALHATFDGFFVAEPVIALVVAHPSSFLQDGVKKRKHVRSASTSVLYGTRQISTGHSQDFKSVAVASETSTNWI